MPCHFEAPRPPDTFVTAGGDNGYGAPGMAENTTKDSCNAGRGGAPWVADQRVRAPPHSDSVVGESSSLSSSSPLHQGSPETCGEGEWGGRGGDNAACRRSRRCRGTPDGGSALPKGQRQRLLRSDSDRAILGRVDYKAVKRDLR